MRAFSQEQKVSPLMKSHVENNYRRQRKAVGAGKEASERHDRLPSSVPRLLAAVFAGFGAAQAFEPLVNVAVALAPLEREHQHQFVAVAQEHQVHADVRDGGYFLFSHRFLIPKFILFFHLLFRIKR